jgi:hypothetical protein
MSCGPSIGSFAPQGTPPCWPCARDACRSQATTCVGDCTCNQVVGESLACVAASGFMVSCFQPYLPMAQTDPALMQFVLCLFQAEPMCCGDGGL